jgi:glutamate dehydrogenase (NAD(P)+)
METKRCGCTLRMAAYIVALKRLIYAEEIKGIFP